nr:MAG TPA: Flagellar and Swarming motility protein [Caudoviricetes sp.]
MDLKELGLEVRESRIEGVLRELKEVISNKDIRFIKLSDIHGKDIYINTNEIISIQEDSEDIDKGTITNITARWGMLLVLATPEEVLEAIKKA